MSASRSRFITATASTFASIGMLRSSARAAEFQFKCGGSLPLDHPASVYITQMWAQVEKETNGRFSCRYFGNGQLGGDVGVINQVRLGATQFYVGYAALSSVVPASSIHFVAFAYKDSVEGFRVADGVLGDYLHKEFEAKGLRLMPLLYDAGMRALTTSNRPVAVAKDLAGLKVRVAESKITVDFFEALGASPAALPFAEVYTAMQTKLVDGEDNTLTIMVSNRYYEVQKFLSLTNHQWAPQALVANADAWKSIPRDIQDIIDRNQRKYALLQRRNMTIQSDAATDRLARLGLKVNTTTQATFRAGLHSYYNTWSAYFGPSVWGLLQNSLTTKLS